MAGLHSAVRKKPRYQWNGEVALTSNNEDFNNHVNLIQASQLLAGKDVDIEDLERPPFSSCSIADLTSLRDNVYAVLGYRMDFAADHSLAIRNKVPSVIRDILQSQLAHDRDMHASRFRPLILLSVLSPFDVGMAIFHFLPESMAMTLSGHVFIHDALVSLGSALSYCAPSGESLLIAGLTSSFSKVESSAALRERPQAPVASLLSLLLKYRTTDDAPLLTCETCIEQIVLPLVEGRALSAGSCVMRVMRNHLKDSASVLQNGDSPHAARVIQAVVEQCAQDTSWNVLSETCERATDAMCDGMDILECYAHCVSGPTFIKILQRTGAVRDIPWPISYHLLPFVAEGGEMVTACREELDAATKLMKSTKRNKTEEEGTRAVEAVERMLLTCATVPDFPCDFVHLARVQNYEGLPIRTAVLIEDLADATVGQWLAALIRQCPQLTERELHRLFNERFPSIVQACIPASVYTDTSKTTEVWRPRLYGLQLGLQTVCGMLRYPLQYCARVVSTAGALRVCRTVSACLVEKGNQLQTGGDGWVIVVTQMLLLFLLHLFDQRTDGDSDGDGKSAACTDMMTVTLLEILKRAGLQAGGKGTEGALEGIRKAIIDFDNGHEYPHKICSAALAALFQHGDRR